MKTKWSCNICGRGFEKPQQIGGHVRMNHYKPKKHCSYCNKDMPFSNFSRHQKKCIERQKPKYCENCGTLHDGTFASGRFCCKKCSRAFTTKYNRKETSKKVSDTVKNKNLKKRYFCKTCKTEIRKNKFGYCIECWKKSDEFKKVTKERTKKMKIEGKFKGWTSRPIKSYAENFFIKVFDNNNLTNDYEFNKKVTKKSLGTNENGNYFLDFFFEKGNIDLEIDGKTHTYPDVMKKDKTRDKLLIKSGYKVYRIQWININSKKGKEYIKEEIDKFLDFYRDVAQTGRALNLGFRGR